MRGSALQRARFGDGVVAVGRRGGGGGNEGCGGVVGGVVDRRRGDWRGLLVVVSLPKLLLVHLARLQTNVAAVRPAQASLTMDRLAALSSRIECPGRHEQRQGQAQQGTERANGGWMDG